jgi:hypothetical protein
MLQPPRYQAVKKDHYDENNDDNHRPPLINGLKIEFTFSKKISPLPSFPKRGIYLPLAKGGKEGF